MITRELGETAKYLFGKYPVITITGPRQSGKTTLVKYLFPTYPYVSLENSDERLYALNDPRGFLARFPKGAVLDEVQRAPELFSYIQTIVDEKRKNSMFVLSGSQNFLLLESITQSLAGRTAVLKLLPFNIKELIAGKVMVNDLEMLMHKGFYPGIYNNEIEPGFFYPNYLQTYIERDVREVKNIGNLSNFIKFVQLCAGRIGQLMNLSSLANDCGISVNTAKSWLSVLESSYIVFFLLPHHRNYNKRLVKMPKIYFCDTGLAASLLRIENHNQLPVHYMRGALFENFVISEFLKYRYNKGLMSNLYFWRDNKGVEIDCIIEIADRLIPIEIKAGKTFSYDFFKNIKYWNNISGNNPENSLVVYGGETDFSTSEGKAVTWKNLDIIIKQVNNE